jgi:very-short-patch-repair endonuclease
MGVRRIKEDFALRTEQRVLEELVRRKLPCEPRVHIGDYEVDILVGQRICVEVDGYYHALKEKMSRDAAKQKYLESLGYVVLRINGVDAKNRHRLKQFASSVVRAYEEERNRDSQQEKALTKGIPQEKLLQLKTQLEKEREKEKQAQRKTAQEASMRVKRLTDEELFLQAIEDLSKRGRK